MPLQKVVFKPGVNRENTRYTNEGGWYESQNVRFRQGTPEKIGGWTQYTGYTFLGVCRLLWNWITVDNINYLAVGTNLKFYLTYGTDYYDITPIRVTATLTNPFTAVTISPFSSTITVNTVTAHGAITGDFVTFSGATGLGGNITAAVLNYVKGYQITVTSSTTYTFTATATSNASDTGNGGTVTAAYQINTGAAYQIPYNGWGAGSWGQSGTTWGNGGTSITNIQLWNAYNFGENLLFGPRGGGLYYWVAGSGTVNTANRGVLLNSLGGAVTFTYASPTVVTFTIPLTEGTSVQFNTTGAMPTGVTASTTYYLYNVQGLTANLLNSSGAVVNTSSTGSLCYISKLVDVPLFQNYIIVSDASRFAIVFGTNDYGSSTIDPMLIRWSDQENPYEWTPDATNQAGSIRLSHGSQIQSAIQTRQEIIVLTDQAVYSFQYVGAPYYWKTQLMGDNISVIGQNSVALASGVIYWMGKDKFYMYDGRVNTLNSDLRKFVFQNINQTQNQQVYASTSEAYNEVWWFYVSGSGNEINAYVVYNYLEKLWYYGTMGRTAWLDSGLLPNPVAATYKGYVVNQESGVDDVETGTAAAIDAYISSSEFDIGDGHNFAFVWRVLPDLTFSGSTNGTSPEATMTLYPMYNSGSGTNNPVANTAYSVSLSANPETFTGEVYTRVRGRQLIIKMESNKVGTTWQLGAPRLDIRPDGRR
jgi:hypothetical protein